MEQLEQPRGSDTPPEAPAERPPEGGPPGVIESPEPTASTESPVPAPASFEAAAPPAPMTELPPAPGLGQSEVAVPAAAPAVRAKTKGVADIVFLIDVSGSMAPIIDALRKNIEVFVDTLGAGDANSGPPVKDWRGKVVGFRDAEHDPNWFHDFPFVRDAVALKAQLAELRAEGGGDEPESLLDALYKVSTMEASPKGAQAEEPTKWRYRSEAARVVVVFTDATFRETMSIPEAKGGALQDVANVVMANRIILSIFAPNFEVYDRLSQIDKSEWEVVEYEGLSAQEALQKFTSDQANFRNTLKQLAASVSKSAETVAL
jgi:hypothetical protein